MKIITIGSSLITVLLFLSTMICGFWIKNNKITDASSIKFHMNSAIFTGIFLLISTILLIIYIYNNIIINK
ncbi:hypothetical protein BM532_11330 [Clostridioides difficile]|nr:hypothetical protein BM532_11330 [Clostridioides difficile]